MGKASISSGRTDSSLVGRAGKVSGGCAQPLVPFPPPKVPSVPLPHPMCQTSTYHVVSLHLPRRSAITEIEIEISVETGLEPHSKVFHSLDIFI